MPQKVLCANQTAIWHGEIGHEGRARRGKNEEKVEKRNERHEARESTHLDSDCSLTIYATPSSRLMRPNAAWNGRALIWGIWHSKPITWKMQPRFSRQEAGTTAHLVMRG